MVNGSIEPVSHRVVRFVFAFALALNGEKTNKTKTIRRNGRLFHGIYTSNNSFVIYRIILKFFTCQMFEKIHNIIPDIHRWAYRWHILQTDNEADTPRHNHMPYLKCKEGVSFKYDINFLYYCNWLCFFTIMTNWLTLAQCCTHQLQNISLRLAKYRVCTHKHPVRYLEYT